MANRRDDDRHDANRDPITGEPGAHPVGVGGGGIGGAAAGGAIGGAIGGPIGAAVGGVVGAVAGAAAGKGVAEMVNPTEEENYWEREYRNRPYYRAGNDFSFYRPAYRYGWESAARPEYANRSFEDVEPDLERNWTSYRGTGSGEWRDVRGASRDAYDRIRTGTAYGMTSATETARAGTSEARQRSSGVWDQVKGNWHQAKGYIKSRWNDLTDDEIDQMRGDRERIVGKIQERYGKEKWNDANIEHELGTFYNR